MLKILYFARLRDQLGKDQEQIELSSSTTVAEVKQQLSQRDDHWHKFLNADNILTAVNQQLCKDDATVQDGDELAFFPPVTGG